MRSRKIAMLAAALVLAALAAAGGYSRADEPVVWLRVDVSEGGHERVKVTLPLSLIEVVIESVDPSRIMTELKSEKGIDLAKLWRQVRNMDLDEFITIDSDEAKVKVFKDREVFRVTIQEEGQEKPNVEVRVPFPIMDYLLEDRRGDFKLSELVDGLRGHLPLVLVEASHDEGRVRVWLEER
jgi:hypothetical protein